MKLVPLSDRVVLKQCEAEETTKSGIILTSSAQEKPQEAEIIAVGPGGIVDGKVTSLEEIKALTNPTIKKHMLEKFADGCDAAAVHLKAAALPGQKYHVIIPINSLKDNEVYAPNYENGTKLALIRYPHGGRFEIPILTVNNKNQLVNKIICKQSIDAVGINHKIADQLSGADFDGDTVMCIPTHDAGGKVKILNKRPLKDLEGFDPKVEYGGVAKKDVDGNVRYYRNGQA